MRVRRAAVAPERADGLRRVRAWRALVALLLSSSAAAADLTATESRWLQGAWPVVRQAQADLALGLMAAHEMGHCRRHVQGHWQAPAPPGRAAFDAGRQKAAIRREEAYGDLVGLAWVQRWHPTRYAEMHAWLVQERQRDRLPGGTHDTLPWLAMAAQAGAFDGAADVFEAADRLWRAVPAGAD